MPFVYAADPVASITTSATPNTEIDALSVKPGARNLAVQGLYVHGKGAGLTAISGITFRLKKYPTTATAVGTGSTVTTVPRDPGAQASKFSSVFSGASISLLTAGTGTLATLLTIGCGAAGPGGWVAPNPDSVHVLEGSATQSLDVWHSSGTASLVCAASLEVVE